MIVNAGNAGTRSLFGKLNSRSGKVHSPRLSGMLLLVFIATGWLLGGILVLAGCCWHVAWVLGGIFWHVASSLEISCRVSGILVLVAGMWLGLLVVFFGMLLLVCFWHFGISCWHVAWVLGGIFWHVVGWFRQ
ncbi:hypothetical protein WN943_002740 [Citrus x changshan-huyou]